jgi:arylsulfatase A-like enzyme
MKSEITTIRGEACAQVGSLLAAAVIFGGPSYAVQAETTTQQQQDEKRPNILLIVADDMGWSDIAPFGGEIRTPHITKLAAEGIQFNQFYVGPACSPTRAMLLSGTDNHLAGMGTNAEVISETQQGKPGYEGHLNDRVASVAETLAASGYETFMAGKWHLGEEPDHWPDKKGFQRSFALMQGGASHFGDEAPMCNDYYPIYAEDGERTHTPDDFYSSRFYADKIIECLKTRKAGKPFFGYLSFTAVHDPIHVPDAWLDAYKGRYDAGPLAIRRARLARQVEMGLFPKGTKLWQIPNPPKGHEQHVPPWAERPEEQRVYSARVMEVYASMVELMDREVGRVVAALKEAGVHDNTYVIFFSDNGANGASMAAYPNTGEEWVARNSDNRLENIGRKGSRNAIGFEWAVTCNSPLRLIKGTIAEGGIRSPLIVAGPGVASGRRSGTPLHVMDMAPTFLRIAGATQPRMREGKEILPMQGKSMLACWADENKGIRSDADHLAWELVGWRAARMGPWKATWLTLPFGQSRWQLFNINRDPGEAIDLSAENPDQLQALVRVYEDYVARCGVIESLLDFGL